MSTVCSYVMNGVHDVLFPGVCDLYAEEDRLISEKCLQLSKLDISPEQLGIRQDYSVPLPAAVSMACFAFIIKF